MRRGWVGRPWTERYSVVDGVLEIKRRLKGRDIKYRTDNETAAWTTDRAPSEGGGREASTSGRSGRATGSGWRAQGDPESLS